MPNIIASHLLDVLKAYQRISELTPEETKALHDDAAGIIADMEDGALQVSWK